LIVAIRVDHPLVQRSRGQIYLNRCSIVVILESFVHLFSNSIHPVKYLGPQAMMKEHLMVLLAPIHLSLRALPCRFLLGVFVLAVDRILLDSILRVVFCYGIFERGEGRRSFRIDHALYVRVVQYVGEVLKSVKNTESVQRARGLLTSENVINKLTSKIPFLAARIASQMSHRTLVSLRVPLM
jgi:hypothetical protein